MLYPFGEPRPRSRSVLTCLLSGLRGFGRVDLVGRGVAHEGQYLLGLIKQACKGKWRPSVAAAKSSGHSESLAIISRLGAPPMVSLRSGRGYHYAMPNAKTAYASTPGLSRIP